MLDRKLDFMIIGAQKAGTTSLYGYLAQHPHVFLPPGKDLFAFNDDPVYGVGAERLGSYFTDCRGEPLVGASNVQILPFPSALKNLQAYNPDLKLIIMLRNPIDRAYSSYWMMRRHGREPSDTFESALAWEQQRQRAKDFRTRAELCYRFHGRYAEHIDRVWSAFPRERVYIRLLDDLKQDPLREVSNLLRWLGADPDAAEIDLSQTLNPSRMPRWMPLQRAIKSSGPLKQLYVRLAPVRVREALNQYLFNPLQDYNLRPFKYPPMAADTRAELFEYYRADLGRLSEMIGRDLSHWQ
jgi:hypothetical protein